MAAHWKCRNGHENDAAVAPAFCPVCGETIVAFGPATVRDIQPTIDLPGAFPDAFATTNAPDELLAKPKSNGTYEANSHINVKVPGYEIIDELGRGGMGVVYKARQAGLNRLVALKMILAAEHAGVADRMRFQTEAQAVAQLQHPNIVQIYEVGEADGRPYFSLEFVDGGSLAQKIQGQPQPARNAAALVEALARAVAAAHEAGIIHRDLKPANVLLATAIAGSASASSLSIPALRFEHPFGFPKITDFGLAKRLEGGMGHTQSGSILGTPSYMAPEQAAGKIKEIGPATDIYALGAILYELLTGRPPFLADTPFETVMQVMSAEPVAPRTLQPKVPRDIEIICLKCLEKAPAKRYGSALDLADDLRRFIEGEPISARPATRVEKARKWVRRHPAAAAMIAVAAVAVAAMVSGALVYHGRLQDALAQTERKNEKLAEEQKLSLERTIHLMVSNGTNHVNQGDHLRSLPWFVEALRLEKGGPAHEEMHRIRLAAVLRQCPRLTRAWFHDGRVHEATFSPDGEMVAAACADGSAYVYRIADDGARPVLALVHPAAVLQARFAPGNRIIVTVCADEAARLWDVKTGKLIGEPLRHAGAVTGAAFAPDGLRVLTTSADRTARIWDVLTGEATRVVFKHSETVLWAEFSPDGDRVVTAGADKAARVWDAHAGKPVSPVLAHQGPVIRAFFSPDGRSVLTASQDGTARVWDIQSGEGVTPYLKRGSPINDAAFTPNGREVATSCADGTARVWDLTTREWRGYTVRHDSPIVDLAVSPDGRALATGGDDNTARVWDLSTGEALTPPLRHNGMVYVIAFSADGSSLLTASLDGLVRLWDLADHGRADGATPMPSAAAGDGPPRLVYSPDRRRLLKIDNDQPQVVQVLDAGSGQPATAPLSHSSPIAAISFSPDATRALTASMDGTARVWNSATGEPISAVMRHGSGVLCAVFSPDGKYVVTGSEDNTARVWNAETGAPITPSLRHTASVLKAAFSPDSRCVLTYAISGRARIWDAATGEALAPPAMKTGWIGQVLDGSQAAAGWDLPPDQRGVDRLGLLARWLSAHQIDAGGNLVPLDSDGLRDVWDKIRTEYPEELARATDRTAWHRQEAAIAEKTHDWYAAIFHLGRLLDAASASKSKTALASLRSRRGRALAEQGIWKAAAADFQIAFDNGRDDEGTLISYALACLGAGDRPAFQKACKLLMEQCGESANGAAACRMAWVCLLSPDAEVDERALDDLAQRAGGAARLAARCSIIRGAKLTRTGKWDDAVRALEQGHVLAEGIDVPRARLFLAIAERKAGHDDAAKRWRSQAALWMDHHGEGHAHESSSQGPELTWQQRLELQVLSSEADKAMAK